MLETLIEKVRRKLKLRKLHRDPVISSTQFRSACDRLLNHSGKFGHWTEGLCLRISTSNRLFKGSTRVDIHWNFAL